MADLNRDYYALQFGLFSMLPPDASVSPDTVNQAMRESIKANTNIKDVGNTLNTDLDVTPSLLRALSKEVNLDTSSLTDEQLSSVLNSAYQTYDAAKQKNYSLLVRSDPRLAFHFLFDKLTQDGELANNAPVVAVRSDTLNNTLNPRNGSYLFNLGAKRVFTSGYDDAGPEAKANEIVLTPFTPGQAPEDQLSAAASRLNHVESARLQKNRERYTRSNSQNNNGGNKQPESEFDKVSNTLGAYLTPSDLSSIETYLNAHPDVKYDRDALKLGAQEAKSFYDQGRTFSIRPGTQDGQFDAVIADSKTKHRLLEPMTKNKETGKMESNKQLIGRLYSVDKGFAYSSSKSGNSISADTLSNYFVGANTTKVIPNRNFGRPSYNGLVPYMNNNGSTSFRDPNNRNSRLYFSPLLNRDPNSREEHRFLNTIKTSYSPEEGTRVANFYLAEARDQYFMELGQTLDSPETYVKAAQNDIRDFMGENGVIEGKTEALEQFGGGPTDNLLQSYAMMDDADEFKKQVINHVRANSIESQAKYADNDSSQLSNVTHHVQDDVLARAKQQKQDSDIYYAGLDDNQKRDFDKLADRVTQHADKTLGRLSDNVNESSIEANRVTDFADHIHSISISNDLRDAFSVSPINQHMIGPEYSQSLVADRSLNYNENSSMTIGQLKNAGTLLNHFEAIVNSQASTKGAIHDIHVGLDSHNVLGYTGVNNNGSTVRGAIKASEVRESDRKGANLYSESISNANNSNYNEYAEMSLDDLTKQLKPEMAAVAKDNFAKIEDMVKLYGHKGMHDIELKMDNQYNIKFTGVDAKGKNVTGVNSYANFANLFKEQRNLLANAFTNERTHEVNFDQTSSRDATQFAQLADYLTTARNQLYDLNVYGDKGIHRESVFYQTSIPDENDPTGTKHDDHGKKLYNVGVNPNGVRNDAYFKSKTGRHLNYPDVRIDSNGVVHWSGYRSIGIPTKNVTDDHGLALMFENGSDTPVQPGPSYYTNSSGKEVYNYSEEQLKMFKSNSSKFKRRKMSSANQLPVVPVGASFGQIFAINQDGIINTNFKSKDNYSYVPGSRAYFIAEGAEDGPNHKGLAERFRVNSFDKLVSDSIRLRINHQLITPLVNLPNDKDAQLNQYLPNKVDEFGNVDFVSVQPNGTITIGDHKENDVTASLDSTALNSTYHNDAYGEALSADYWNQSRLPLELKKLNIETLGAKTRFPNLYGENGNTLSHVNDDSEMLNNENAASVKSAVQTIMGNQNFREFITDLQGIMDPYVTATGKLQGIANYLDRGVEKQADGTVKVRDDIDPNDPSMQQVALLSSIYFKYAKATPEDRLQMAANQVMTALSVDEDTNTMLSTFGGFTFDDANVISKEYAERNPINLNATKGKNYGPNEKTLKWFDHELDVYVASDRKNLGGRDWGPNSEWVLHDGSILRNQYKTNELNLHRFLDSDAIPTQPFEVSDQVKADLQSSDEDVKNKAILAQVDANRDAKLNFIKQQFSAAQKGEPVDLDDATMAKAQSLVTEFDASDEAYSDFQNKYATTRPLQAGDKISNFPGNKGIIGLVVDRNMDPAEAKKKDIEREVAVFKQNPELDSIQSPNSIVSRNNMSLIQEMQDKHNDGDQTEVKLNGEVIGYMGKVNTINTDIFTESKTHSYNDPNSQGRKFSSQLVWALQQHGANHVVKEAFSQNNRAWHDYREYLMVTGYDLTANGDYQVGYAPHAGEDRKVFKLAGDNDNPDDLLSVKDGDDFFRKLGSSGGMLKLPFEVQLRSGVKTDQLPVLSASLRKDSEQLDGTISKNDYTNDYGMIVDAAQDYLKAKNMPTPDQDMIDAKASDMSQKVDSLQSKIIIDKLGGESGENIKRSFVRQHMIAKRLHNSATSVWQADPRCDLDTVKVSPEIYKAIGPKDKNGKLIPFDQETGRPQENPDAKVMLWRDPCLHAGSVRSFKIQVDPDIDSVAINPVNDKPFDGDFDGDTVGLMRFSSPEANKELDEMAIQNHLIAPHSDKIPQEDQVSELNCSMDFVAGFHKALQSQDGINRINDALGEGHELTPDDIESGLTKPKKLLNKTLVDIATRYDGPEALAKSNDLVDMGMRDYNFGSVQMPFVDKDKTLEAIQFQQDLGIKGKPGMKPVRQVTGQDKQGNPVYGIGWETNPKDPTTGEPMVNYKGFSPKTIKKTDGQGHLMLNKSGEPMPELDSNGHEIPLKDSDGNVMMQRDTLEVNGKEYNGIPSAVGKCDIYLSNLKDKSDDPVYGDAFKNLSNDIRTAMGVKSDDTGVAGSYSQQLFSVLRTVNPTAALELTYPITQATLQIKHDADKARLVNDTLNGPLKNLYAGHDANYTGGKSKEAKKLAKIKPDKWIEEMTSIYKDQLGVDVDDGYVHQVADAMTDKDGNIMGTSDLMNHKAAQIDVTSFGNGFETIAEQAANHVNVMGPSNDTYQKFRKEHGYSDKMSVPMSEQDNAKLLSQTSAASDMRPSDVDKHIELIAEGKSEEEAKKYDVSLSNHGKAYDTQATIEDRAKRDETQVAHATKREYKDPEHALDDAKIDPNELFASLNDESDDNDYDLSNDNNLFMDSPSNNSQQKPVPTDQKINPTTSDQSVDSHAPQSPKSSANTISSPGSVSVDFSAASKEQPKVVDSKSNETPDNADEVERSTANEDTKKKSNEYNSLQASLDDSLERPKSNEHEQITKPNSINQKGSDMNFE